MKYLVSFELDIDTALECKTLTNKIKDRLSKIEVEKHKRLKAIQSEVDVSLSSISVSKIANTKKISSSLEELLGVL